MAGRGEDSGDMEYVGSGEEAGLSGESRESAWTDVRKKASQRKRKKKTDSSSGGTESEEEIGREKREGIPNVVVRFEGEDGVKKLSPLKLTKIVRDCIGEVKYVRVLGDGNLLVGCSNEEQVGKAKKLSSLGNIKVSKVAKVGDRSAPQGCRGVITRVPLEVEMKELVLNLQIRDKTVKSARRMTRGVEKKETESVLIEFSGKKIPEELFFGFVKYNVREYIPKPIRCYKCQEFGHLAKDCKGTRRCARCGGDHEYGQCGEGVQPKCCNCGGNHSVAYWGCEAMRREIDVQQTKVKEKVSYAEAVKRLSHGSQETGKKQKEHVSVVVKEVRKTMVWEEKKKLVTFIAGVINATSDVKSKTERIQIIVKAAVHHLDMVGLKWEEVRDDLSVQASQDPCIGC